MNRLICKHCGAACSPTNAYCGNCGGMLLAATGTSRAKAWWLFLLAPVLLCGLCSQRLSRPEVKISDPTTTAAATAQPLSDSQRILAAKDVLAKESASLANAKRARSDLGYIPKAAPEYKESQILAKKLNERIAKQEAEETRREAQATRERAPALREQLKRDYENVVSAANPHLNYIGSKLTKSKGGYALWATHDFFTQYTFSAGDDAKVVSAWISNNRLELKQAQIVRVGVMGNGEYASWSYFDLD